MKEPSLKLMSKEQIEKKRIEAYNYINMKEQTPITADQFLSENYKGYKAMNLGDEIEIIMEQYAQAKVLEALEREFNKIPYIKHYNNGIVNTIGSKYYETEVKPRYERDTKTI
jgi:hypothetical protein